jgi:hypothetical protein
MAMTMGHLSINATVTTQNYAEHWQGWALGVADGVERGVPAVVRAGRPLESLNARAAIVQSARSAPQHSACGVNRAIAARRSASQRIWLSRRRGSRYVTFTRSEYQRLASSVATMIARRPVVLVQATYRSSRLNASVRPGTSTCNNTTLPHSIPLKDLTVEKKTKPGFPRSTRTSRPSHCRTRPTQPR